MVFTIQRYIFWDLLKTFLMATAILSLILGLGVMLRPLKEYGVEPTRVPELILCTLPITLTMVVPIAALLSATLTYGRLAVDNEINACRSSGIGLITLMYPALTLALLVAFGTLLLAFHVIPSFTARFDEIIKSDAEAIIYRNIEKSGSLGKLGGEFSRYQVYAQRAYPEKHRLENVTVLQTDKQDIQAVFSARAVTIKFTTENDRQEMVLKLYDYTSNNRRGGDEMSTQAKSTELIIPMPSIWQDDIKFKKLDQMQKIREDMTRFGPINDLFENYKRQLAIENFYHHCDQHLSEPGNFIDFSINNDRLRVRAQDVTLKSPLNKKAQEKGRIKGAMRKIRSANLAPLETGKVEIDYYYKGRPNTPSRQFKANKVKLQVDPLRRNMRANLALENVTWTNHTNPREYSDRNYLIPNLKIPDSIQAQSNNLTLPEVLANPAHPENTSNFLNLLYKRLKKSCNELEAEIVVELHTRLAFGVSCVVLVLFGSALGVILKSGHLLSAFGVSCIPAIFCLTTIFTGKHIVEDSASSMGSGMLFLWSGIIIVAIADFVIYKKLLKQ